jgi:hypothetical protein
MRSVFWFLVAFFLILTIYRRIIEPFLEGYRHARKPYNEPRVGRRRKKKQLIDRSSVEDADFKDIE